jgi:hypothetical protein
MRWGGAALPRYRFNRHCEGHRREPISQELADLDTACRQAIKHLAQLMNDDPAAFLCDCPWRLDVTDESGLVAATLCFSARDGTAHLL